MDLGVSQGVENSDFSSDETGYSADPITSRVLANINAIKLAQDDSEASNLNECLVNEYDGWGGIAPFFNKPEYQGLREELTELVGLEAFNELRASILSSYYTPNKIAEIMWYGLEKLGFTGGKILEPAAGCGALLSNCPSHIAEHLDIVAVEKCPVTASVLSKRFPNANVINKGFESTCLPYDYYDVVLLNPPFLNANLQDEYDRKLKATEHNFFLLKAMKTVREGGIVCAVVTRYFLDAKDSKHRDTIAEQANLLAAYRLDKSTFGNDNTDVITDLIFLQKTSSPLQSTWTQSMDVSVINNALVKVDEPVTDIDYASISQVYLDNPNHIIGKVSPTTDQFNKPMVDVVRDFSVQAIQQIADLMGSLSKVYEDAFAIKDDRHDASLDVDHYVELMGVDIDNNGVPFRRILDKEGIPQYERLNLNNRQLHRLQGWLVVKSALYALLQAERTESDDNVTDELREQLNDAYDVFVGQFGALNSKGNRFMRQCASYSRLIGLELFYDAGVSKEVAKKKGIPEKAASWERAPLLSRRMNWPIAPIPTKASSSKDALILSVQYKGRVDIDYMLSLTDKEEDELLNELVGLIFFNVESDCYELASIYLSGNVIEKIQACEASLKSMPFLQMNIDALNEVKPTTIPAEDITVSFGAPWLPDGVMHDFIDHLLSIKSDAPKVSYIGGRWQMPLRNTNVDNSKNTITYASEGYSALDIINKLLHHNSLKVFDTIDDKKVLNVEATQALQDCAARIKQEFQDWVYIDSERREKIVEIYNNRFNAFVVPEIDGEILVDDDGYLPNQNKSIKLRSHQLNAVARSVLGKSTLIDVPVGGGKSAIAIFSILLQRRLGLINKAAVVVPNHLISNWVSEIAKFAPETKVLVCDEFNTKKENRELLLASIAYGDYDVIIIAKSTFYLIPCEADYTKDFVQGFIDEIEIAESQTDERMTLRELEKTKHALKNKLLALTNTQKRDATKLTFETLGIDYLVCDEAHEKYKNLFYLTAHNNVGGLGPQDGAMMALDLFMKARYLQTRNAGRGLCFLTGTSITNSPIEVYHLLRYFMFEEAERLGLHHADEFISVFSEPETRFELSPSGKYADRTRIRQFSNVPELVALMRQFTFVITKDELREQCKEKGIPWFEPEMRGGKAKMIVCERSMEQGAYMADLVCRAENLKNVDPKDDNMLKICSDAAKASLDMRLIEPSLPKNPNGKLPLAARVAAQEYNNSHDVKGVVLIFIDLGTPTSNGLNLYQEVKDDLISFGVRENEIAFIHDAKNNEQKQVLSDRVNAGEIRILLCSTAKGGTGLNVQSRIVAILNADLSMSWTAAAYEQRLGRGFRSGNILLEQTRERGEAEHEIAVYNFATDLSLDAFRFGLLETKAKFVSQIKQAQVTERVIRDDDMEDSEDSFAQIKAAVSGNPLILASVNTEREIKTLCLQARAHWRAQTVSREFVSAFKNVDEQEDEALSAIQRDMTRVEPYLNKRVLIMGGNSYEPSTDAQLEEMEANAKEARGKKMAEIKGKLKLVKDEARKSMTNALQAAIQRLNNEYQIASRPVSKPRCELETMFKKALQKGFNGLNARKTSSVSMCEYRGLKVSLKYQGWRVAINIEGEHVGWSIEVPKSESPRIDSLLHAMDGCIDEVNGWYDDAVRKYKSIREDLIVHMERKDKEFEKQEELEAKEELLRAIQQALISNTELDAKYHHLVPTLTIEKPPATVAEDIVLPDSVAPDYGLSSGAVDCSNVVVLEQPEANQGEKDSDDLFEAMDDESVLEQSVLCGNVTSIDSAKKEKPTESCSDTLSQFKQMSFM